MLSYHLQVNDNAVSYHLQVDDDAVSYHLQVDDAVLDVEDQLQRLVVSLDLVDVQRQVLHLFKRPLEGVAVRCPLVCVLY